MNKRNFLRKGASLVGSGALLGSAFMPGSSAGAITQDEMVKSFLKDSWKYFFARMFAAVGIIPSWKTEIEKEASETVTQKLKQDIKKFIDENFESGHTGFAKGKNHVNGRSCQIKNKEGRLNVCIEKVVDEDEDEGLKQKINYRVYTYYFTKDEYREIRKKVCSIEDLNNASFEDASDFFEKLDYYVTLSKIGKLFAENKNLFSTKRGISYWFDFKRDGFCVEGKKVESLCIGDNLFIEDNEYNDDFVTIVLEGGSRVRNIYPNEEWFRTRSKITSYMKEILKQAEQKYGAKVLGTENKERNKVDKSNVIVGDTMDPLA